MGEDVNHHSSTWLLYALSLHCLQHLPLHSNIPMPTGWLVGFISVNDFHGNENSCASWALYVILSQVSTTSKAQFTDIFQGRQTKGIGTLLLYTFSSCSFWRTQHWQQFECNPTVHFFCSVCIARWDLPSV